MGPLTARGHQTLRSRNALETGKFGNHALAVNRELLQSLRVRRQSLFRDLVVERSLTFA